MNRPDQIPEDQIVKFYRDQIAENDSLSSECVDDILTYATRLEARVKELEAANQWQPIETVPKDGTVVRLAFKFDEAWEQDERYYYNGAWAKDVWQKSHIVRNVSYAKPARWRPLPPPPEAD